MGRSLNEQEQKQNIALNPDDFYVDRGMDKPQPPKRRLFNVFYEPVLQLMRDLEDN